jgi:hypothetical protein
LQPTLSDAEVISPEKPATHVHWPKTEAPSAVVLLLAGHKVQAATAPLEE